jgi:hypothetical protein
MTDSPKQILEALETIRRLCMLYPFVAGVPAASAWPPTSPGA